MHTYSELNTKVSHNKTVRCVLKACALTSMTTMPSYQLRHNYKHLGLVELSFIYLHRWPAISLK